MALSYDERATIGRDTQHHLADTPYACTSLTIMDGGTANFLFRGVLAQPLADGEETVVVKHTREYVSANRNFALDITRCKHELIMIKAMAEFQIRLEDDTCIRTPRLYYFDSPTSTQIMEDLSNTMSMTEALVSNARLTSGPYALGKALGIWLQRFHSWSADAPQARLRSSVYENSAMRKIRYDISYGAFVDILKKFPFIWESKKDALDEVKHMAIAEYAIKPYDEPDKSWGLIHGDFWTGNVLVSKCSVAERSRRVMELFIIDWELAQYGRREYDLGQMIGDLYERKVFAGAEDTISTIQGFVSGYGPLSEEEACRVAIHAGQHLVCWYIRRDPESSLAGLEKQVEEAMRIGSDFIVKGWERDQKWFAKSDLSCLFLVAANLE